MTVPDQTTERAPTAGDVVIAGAGRIRGWITAGGWMPLLAVVVVAVPPLLLIGPLITHHGVFSNWGDVAANELSVQNATHLNQTLGPYDRFGWNHPGPMLFYLMAIPYVLMDWSGAALGVGAALINLAAAVGVVGLMARRAGGKAALGTAAVICAFEFVLGAPSITNSWGPAVVVLPAVLFFVLCADLAAGAVWSLVGAVAVGSFLVQTEVSTGSAVVAGLLLAVAVRGAAWLKAGTFRQSLRSSIWAGLGALIVGAVVWAPPAWQELTNYPGNFGVLVNFLWHANGHHGFGGAFSALAGGVVNPLSRLPGGRSTGHPSAGALALFLVGVGLLAVICWWRRQWFACALAGGIPLVAGVCVLTLRRVDGPIYPYLLVWTGALTVSGALALVLCVSTPARPVSWLPRWGDPARLLGALLLAAGAILCGWRLSDSAFRVESGTGNLSVTQASDTVEQMLPRQDHRVLLCVAPAAWPTSTGVAVNLRKHGRDPRVSQQWLVVFGRQLAPSGREQVAVFLDSAAGQLRRLSVNPQRRALSGGLTIRTFQPRHGYVPATLCPPGF